jgi:hypothetical protein
VISTCRVRSQHGELTLRPREVVVVVVTGLSEALPVVVRAAGGFRAAALALVVVVVPVASCTSLSKYVAGRYVDEHQPSSLSHAWTRRSSSLAAPSICLR